MIATRRQFEAPRCTDVRAPPVSGGGSGSQDFGSSFIPKPVPQQLWPWHRQFDGRCLQRRSGESTPTLSMRPCRRSRAQAPRAEITHDKSCHGARAVYPTQLGKCSLRRCPSPATNCDGDVEGHQTIVLFNILSCSSYVGYRVKIDLVIVGVQVPTQVLGRHAKESPSQSPAILYEARHRDLSAPGSLSLSGR